MRQKLYRSLFTAVHGLCGLRCSRKGGSSGRGRLLLIRLDGIGDYVLFRNFIRVLRQTGPYRNHHITLLGNRAWKDLALALDSGTVDAFIWIDQTKFMTNVRYHFKKLREIRSVDYDTAVSSVYSRDFGVTDTLISLVRARRKIGSTGDLTNTTARKQIKGDRFYTALIPAAPGVMFEFDRNRAFFEGLLGIDIGLKKPGITRPTQPAANPKDYAVLFIGAGEKKRQWPVSAFAKVAGHLRQTYGLAVVLCGGPEDLEAARLFSKDFPPPYTDLVGRIPLPGLLRVMAPAKLLVSNETAAPHLAAALGLPHIFVVSNGNYLGRFAPYPKPMCPGYHLVCHPGVRHRAGTPEAATSPSWLDMADIPAQTVINRISACLSRIHCPGRSPLTPS